MAAKAVGIKVKLEFYFRLTIFKAKLVYNQIL